MHSGCEDHSDSVPSAEDDEEDLEAGVLKAHEETRKQIRVERLANWKIDEAQAPYVPGGRNPGQLLVCSLGSVLFVVFALAIIAGAAHHHSPNFWLVVGATMTLLVALICFPVYRRPIGFPDIVKYVDETSARYGVDDELLAHCYLLTGLTTKTRATSQSTRHIAVQWIRKNRPNWSTKEQLSQVTIVIALCGKMSPMEDAILAEWSAPDSQRGIWWMHDWVKNGRIHIGGFFQSSGGYTPVV